MAQYALPISDDFSQGASEGAGNANGVAWDELDEGFGAGRGSGSGPDDATTYWILDPDVAPNAQILANLSGVTDPNSSDSHIVRTRNRKSAAAGQQHDVLLRLRQGGTDIVNSANMPNISEVWQTRTITLTAAQADSITDYSNLKIASIFNQVGGGADRNGNESAYEFECPDAPAAGGEGTDFPWPQTNQPVQTSIAVISY